MMSVPIRNPLSASLAIALLLTTVPARAQDNCSTDGDRPTHTRAGEQMPAFTVTESDGASFALTGQRGKVVVINFWATWCGPCQTELPQLEKQVWQKHKDDPRFAMVAIAREQTDKDIVPFRRKKGFTFPIAGDPGRATYKLFADSGIPRSYVVDQNGKILFQSLGYCPDSVAQLSRAVDKALATTGK